MRSSKISSSKVGFSSRVKPTPLLSFWDDPVVENKTTNESKEETSLHPEETFTVTNTRETDEFKYNNEVNNSNKVNSISNTNPVNSDAPLADMEIPYVTEPILPHPIMNLQQDYIKYNEEQLKERYLNSLHCLHLPHMQTYSFMYYIQWMKKVQESETL